jgi:hypothetical protein
MITLYLKDGGEVLGEIEEADLELLIDQLEEESEDDTDYYITPLTIDMLEEAGAGTELVELLRDAVGDSFHGVLCWSAPSARWRSALLCTASCS